MAKKACKTHDDHDGYLSRMQRAARGYRPGLQVREAAPRKAAGGFEGPIGALIERYGCEGWPAVEAHMTAGQLRRYSIVTRNGHQEAFDTRSGMRYRLDGTMGVLPQDRDLHRRFIAARGDAVQSLVQGFSWMNETVAGVLSDDDPTVASIGEVVRR